MAKEIWNHKDYRDFLKEKFNSKKEQNPKFSYQYCALKLSSSRSYLKLVLDKKRHVKADKLGPIIKLFSLNNFEKQVLIFLFLKSIVSDSEIKKYCNQTLKSMGTNFKDPSFRKLILSPSNYQIHEALVMIIDALLDTKEPPTTIDEIKEKLKGKWTKKQIKEAYKVVMDHKKEKGVDVTGPEAGDIEGFKKFQIGLQLSHNATETPYEHRPCNFSMLSISLSDEDVKLYLKKMNELRDLAIKLAQKNTGSQVYLISNNFAALSN